MTQSTPQDKVQIIREQAVIQLKSMLTDARAPGALIRMTVSQNPEDNYLVRARFAAQECLGGPRFEMDVTFSMRTKILPARPATRRRKAVA